MKSEREDYIKTIYKLIEQEGVATHKRLSESLGISGASVSQMIKKLKEVELVCSEKKAIMLTENGEALAKKILSRHRLWETFLYEYLDMPWHGIHKHAELLEHVTDDELTDKLSQFLGNPAYCPHGGTIFDNNHEKRATTPLADASINKTVTVARIYDHSALLKHLKSKNIGIGSVITVLQKSDFDASLTIKVEGNTCELSRKAAMQIQVVV